MSFKKRKEKKGQSWSDLLIVEKTGCRRERVKPIKKDGVKGR